MMSKRSSQKEADKNEELEAVVFNFKNFNKTLNNFFEKKRPKISIGKKSPSLFQKEEEKREDIITSRSALEERV